MTFEDIEKECFERKRIEPTKTPAEIVASVMADRTAFRVALGARPEFKSPVPEFQPPPDGVEVDTKL